MRDTRDENTKTTHDASAAPQGSPPARRWVVLRSREKFWRAAAQWSALILAAVAGAAVIGWSYATGSDSAVSAFFLRKPGRAVGTAEAPPLVPEPARRRAIDGVPYDGTDGAPFAVMIDNMIDARPPSGLSAASLVIDAPVEGGITRFLAVFAADAAARRIGPVRSARPYYLDWAAEVGALYVHVGGSPEALDLIKSSRLQDLNQFFAAKYFWRDAERRAPHNVYTSVERLSAARGERFDGDGADDGVSPWKFKEDAPSEMRPPSGGALEVAAANADYAVRWVYDRDNNSYRRFSGGDEQFDEDGNPLRAKNVVVQYAKVRVLDEVGRRRVATVGEGEALIAVDGELSRGSWRKQDAGSRTRFYDDAGNEIAFNAGATWVEVVPNGTTVTSE